MSEEAEAFLRDVARIDQTVADMLRAQIENGMSLFDAMDVLKSCLTLARLYHT